MVEADTISRHRARRGEGDKLRVQILDAAEALLIETGNQEAVSMRAIAQSVGCTPPAIYLHFEDKETLFHEVCARRFEQFDERLEKAAAGIDDPLESLRARGRAYIEFGLQHPEHYRLIMMTSMEQSLEEKRLLPGSPGVSAFEHLVEAVDRCVETGALDGEVMQITLLLWAGVHGLTSLMITFPNLVPQDTGQIDLMCDVMIEGLLAV